MTICRNKALLGGYGLSKSYQDKLTIKDITVELFPGEIVSILGVSGVGKTTLFNILSGLEAPDSGKVLFRGEDVTGKTGLVSYMQQKDLLLPFRTILDNVAVPLRLRGLEKTAAREQAAAYFADFGISGCENKYPSQLSGGMRQRAAVLRSYLFSGEIMLLDEPFSALDALTKASMHRWYEQFVRSKGSSAFLITHDIDEALTLSDRIYIIKGQPGQISYELQLQRRQNQDKDFSDNNLSLNDFSISAEYLDYKREILAHF